MHTSACQLLVGGKPLDSNAMKVSLPRPKLMELKKFLATWQSCQACRKELESLVGKLAHACKVVWPGKMFLHRMLKVVLGVRQPYHRIRLNAEFQSDLTWWVTFLESWNGVSLHQEFGLCGSHIRLRQAHSVVTPCGVSWLQLQWPQPCREDFLQLKGASITFKELLLVVTACMVWGTEW